MSVNDVIISTVTRYLLTKYGIPELPNHHIRCLCHVVNLIVQSILATLGEADDPQDNNHFLLNKDQPFHLDINSDADQVALDCGDFSNDSEDNVEENVTMRN